MSNRLKAVAAMQLSNGWLRVEKRRQLLSISVLVIAMTGCGSPTCLDVLAYDACIAGHPQEVALCEGPRQAYELEPTAFQARVEGIKPLTSRYEGRAAVIQPPLTHVLPLPSPVASGRNG